MTTGRGPGKLAAMAQAAGEAGIRELVAGWLAAERPGDDGRTDDGRAADGRLDDDPAGNDPARNGSVGGGWAVPPADGAVVVAAARRLAVDGLARRGPRTAVPDGLRMIAEALVVDEHPSAARWTPLERAQAVEWVALLLHRFGEDGVALLTADLLGEPGPGEPGPGASGVGDPEPERPSAG
ncbi:hypothetical protein ABTX81_23520 [Kitasatospora sp. NPDC097605]|uniref:hypothetical protein n=1 Tax=Kitasatospora sp. NPDC097605 TaxID=3157226 RepID=UPI00331B560C